MVISLNLIGCPSLFNLFLARTFCPYTRSPRIKATARITAMTMPAMAPGAKADTDLETLGLADAGRGAEAVAGSPGQQMRVRNQKMRIALPRTVVRLRAVVGLRIVARLKIVIGLGIVVGPKIEVGLKIVVGLKIMVESRNLVRVLDTVLRRLALDMAEADKDSTAFASAIGMFAFSLAKLVTQVLV